MKTGYFKELEKFRKDDPSADFGFLENTYEGTTLSANTFLHGYCHIFAATLSDRFGYAIEMLTDFENQMIHTYCVSTLSDKPLYIDIRGMTDSAEEFFSEFEDEGVRIIDGELDVSQFNEGYLKATKYLSSNSFFAMNPSFLFDVNEAVCRDAETFVAVNSDEYDVLWQMETSNLYGCSSRTFRKQLGSIEEVAQFIMDEGKSGERLQIYKDQTLFITTFGVFLDKVSDKDYRDKLVSVLVPKQQAYETEVFGV